MKPIGMIAGLLLAGAMTCAAQDGKQIYSDKCATCHGADGAAKTARGKQLKVKSAKEGAKMSLPDLIKIVTDGKGLDMPGYTKQLTALQIQAVVDYYRGLGK